jgi:hypothetical protein
MLNLVVKESDVKPEPGTGFLGPRARVMLVVTLFELCLCTSLFATPAVLSAK